MLFKFHDFRWLSPWPFQVFQDLKFSCHFRISLKFLLVLGFFFDLKQFNRHKLWYPPKCVPFALFNYSSLSYIVLALSSAVTNLTNKTLIFHDFHGPTIKFLDFPGLENEILKFHDFPGFLWPVRTLSIFKAFKFRCKKIMWKTLLFFKLYHCAVIFFKTSGMRFYWYNTYAK